MFRKFRSVALPGVGMSGVWNPSFAPGLYAAPAIALCRQLGLLWQDSGKTTLATAASDPVRVVKCPFTGVEFTAPSDATRPALTNPSGDVWCLTFDGSDDCLDFAGLASIPLSLHAAGRWTGGTGLGVAGTGFSAAVGGQKLKLWENGGAVQGFRGGKNGIDNWSFNSTTIPANTDYVAGLNYASTGAATNYLNGVADGTAVADVAAESLSGNVTRVGATTTGGEPWTGRFYAWAIYAQAQSTADIGTLHIWLAGYQGRML